MMRSTDVRRYSAWLLLAGFSLLAASAPAAAQQTGVVRGKVTAGGGARPLLGAQVSIAGTGRGALTNSSGDFEIDNVPYGAQTVRVQLLGYATAERQVTVGPDAVTLQFELVERAVALDEIVVTGTAGGTQRRAIGNVVDRINVASVIQTTPATSVNQLISQRSPGVQVMGGAGTVGAGAPIHIRGLSSMTLDATPLIFIDGVRMDSRMTGPPGVRGGARQSRLDDIDLEDIESIEIIKGPAAATLYGTEASNGVIQIVTKRGVDGPAQFDITLRGGTNWLWNPAGKTGFSYAGGPVAGAPLDSVNLYAHERDLGPWGDPFTYGRLGSIDLGLRGGVERVRYFISGGYDDQVGVVPYNWQKVYSARSNVDALLSRTLSARFSMAYIRRDYRAAQQNDPVEAFGNLVWGSPSNLDTKWRGFQAAPPEASAEIDSRQEVRRTMTSVELRHTPFTWLTNRLVAGIDAGQDETYVLYPRDPAGAAGWWGSNSLGNKNSARQDNTILTLDYGSSASRQITQEVRATTSIGFQYYHLGSKTIGATATQFAAPPLTTISAGALTSGREEFIENATVGLYVQQQIDWRNRVFLTGAVRGDDNSAFGAEYEAAIYPKLSATWVVHEEPFWKLDWVSKFRVRGAWGAAGKQPSTFAAVQLYAPVTGFADQPGLAPNAIGNPALKPERSEELELGFDLGLLNDRVEILFTRYDRVVKDAMISVPLPPSLGFVGTQIVNLGRVKGWGNEVQVNARLLEGRRLGWDLGFGFATNGNRIEDLGPGTIGVGSGFSQHLLGFSIADLYWWKVVSADFVSGTSGPVTNVMCDGGTGRHGREMGGEPVSCASAPLVRWGHSQPTWQITVAQNLRLGEHVRVFAAVDGTGGHKQQDSTDPANHTTYCSTRACRVQDDPIVMAYRAIGRNPLGIYEAGFLKLREVSATYTLPSTWAAHFNARSASVSLGGRNLMTLWTAQMGWNTPRGGNVIIPLGNGRVWDPETRSSADLSTGYQTVMPPLASAVVTVRMSF